MHLVHTKRAPQYLSDSVQTVARSSSRPGLRSSNTAVYTKPRCRTKFGEHSFSHAGPTAWNSLPDQLRQITDTGLFKCCLKTELLYSIKHIVVSSVSTSGQFKNSTIQMSSSLLLLQLQLLLLILHDEASLCYLDEFMSNDASVRHANFHNHRVTITLNKFSQQLNFALNQFKYQS